MGIPTAVPDITYWVYTDLGSAFSAEVRRRFQLGAIPPMNDWVDGDFCIRTYVVWPPEDTGKPLYRTVKRHWWSWNGRLSYESPAGWLT